MFFTSKKRNKRIVNAKAAAAEKRPLRKNRFKKNTFKKSNVRKFKVSGLASLLGALAGLIATSIILIFIHDFFTQTQYFSIQEIKISGTEHLTCEKILDLTGVTIGDNLFGINLKRIRNKILTDPWIKGVQISRKIPDGIWIDIVEHTPEAIAKIENEIYLLNREGELFKTFGVADPRDLPVITGISYTDIPVANFLPSNQFAAVRKVLELGRTEEALIPSEKIRQIHIDRELGLTLEVFEPAISIQIGYGNYSQKYDNLQRVLAYFKDRKEQIRFNAVDLRDLDQIVVTPATTESPRQG